jgi:hypothetical protein
LGKSRLVIKHLRERLQAVRGKPTFEEGPVTVVWYLTATTRLAEELAVEYGQGTAVVRGRTNGMDDPDATPPCRKAKLVREAMWRGVTNIAGSFCAGKDKDGNEVTCPYWHECDYQDQFAAVSGAEIVFMAHDYMFLTIGKEKIPRPDLIVVDESPVNAFVSMSARFTPDAVRESAGAHSGLAEIILSAFDEGRDPRDALIDAGFNAGALTKAAAELDQSPKVWPGMTDEEVREALAAAKSSKASILFKRIADEMEYLDRQLYGAYQVRVKKRDGDGVQKVPVIYCQHRKKPKLKSDVPLLLLDGTAVPVLLRATCI